MNKWVKIQTNVKIDIREIDKQIDTEQRDGHIEKFID